MCRGPDRDRSWFVRDPRMEISRAAARLARNLAEASLRAVINAGSASGLNRPGSDATRGLGDPMAFWPRRDRRTPHRSSSRPEKARYPAAR
jgi:hypothetical protein